MAILKLLGGVLLDNHVIHNSQDYPHALAVCIEQWLGEQGGVSFVAEYFYFNLPALGDQFNRQEANGYTLLCIMGIATRGNKADLRNKLLSPNSRVLSPIKSHPAKH